MTMTATTSSIAMRRGRALGGILAHAKPVMALGITGVQEKMPRNQGEEIVFRRFIPFGATIGAMATTHDTQNRMVFGASAVGRLTPDDWIRDHALADGVTPVSNELVPFDVPVRIQEFGCLYGFTNRARDLHEDDIPEEMKEQVGTRVGMVQEMIRYGELRSATNRFFGGTGTTRATVNGPLTLSILRRMARSLKANHSMMVTRVLDAGVSKIGTRPVEPSWLVFAHTNAESDIRNLPNFTPAAEYGSGNLAHDFEVGSVESFRFILSPELVSWDGAGAAVGATGLLHTANVIDVYPVIVAAKDAWGQLALRGMDVVDPSFILPKKSAADPLGQRGFVGAKFYAAARILNQGWMAVAEVGVSDLA